MERILELQIEIYYLKDKFVNEKLPFKKFHYWKRLYECENELRRLKCDLC